MQIREESIFYFWILGYLMFQTLNHTDIFPIQRKHFKDSSNSEDIKWLWQRRKLNIHEEKFQRKH